MTRRRGRSRKQILDDLKISSGSWKLKEEALDRTLWKRLWICLKTDYVANGGRWGGSAFRVNTCALPVTLSISTEIS